MTLTKEEQAQIQENRGQAVKVAAQALADSDPKQSLVFGERCDVLARAVNLYTDSLKAENTPRGG